MRLSIVNPMLKVVVLVCGVLFLVTGLRWLLAPAGVAPEFGLALSTGVGLSSQIGDMSAFFLTLGVCILMGLTSQHTIWYYPPIILLSLTAVGRVLAWLLHDAALATGLIAPEVIVALILLIASRRLATQG